MNNNFPASRVIIGIQQMANYLGISRFKINDYIKAGMPGCFISGKWHFHIENVDLWFRSLTARGRQADPDSVQETAD